MDIAIPEIDLGKAVWSPAGLDCPGAVVFRKRIQRFALLSTSTAHGESLGIWS